MSFPKSLLYLSSPPRLKSLPSEYTLINSIKSTLIFITTRGTLPVSTTAAFILGQCHIVHIIAAAAVPIFSCKVDQSAEAIGLWTRATTSAEGGV